MGSVKVTVFGRIKPRLQNTACQDYKLKYGDHEDEITFTARGGKKVFRFKKIFPEDATQEQLFDVVAKPVIQNVFEGYNGTIFTYGQTGSGKTHTMTGLSEWREAGLIPRTLHEIFKMKESNTVISIAYFEIYNEHVYDLVRTKTFDSETQQFFIDETSGTNSFRNLSMHVVHSPGDALELFQRGDMNKMMAETSSNSKSSRSHVIFSIAFEFPHPKEDTVSLKPVLYLVDLAGSERISKTKGPSGNPWETRNINLSLHYLEQVLIALREPGRVHIPYRNSLMTALLKNSLGGNCLTSMIATLSMSIKDIDETLQTCRFSERIALIKNEVKLSKLSMPEKEIENLKKENELLKAQLKLLTSDQLQEQLNEEDKDKCNEMVQNFIQENDFFALPLTDVRRMEFCFKLMRNEILKNKLPDTLEPRNSGTIRTLKCNIWRQESLASKKDIRIIEKHEMKTIMRSQLELPKVNISYSGWSTETLSEKENDPPINENRRESKENVKTMKNSEEIQVTMNEISTSTANSSTGNDPSRPKNKLGFTCSNESKKENLNSMTVKNSNNVIKHGLLSSPKKSEGIRAMNETFSYGESPTFFDKSVFNLAKKVLKRRSFEEKPQMKANLPLTGDREVDEEILKFYESRTRVFQQSNQSVGICFKDGQISSSFSLINTTKKK